jgi:hypothetical protein
MSLKVIELNDSGIKVGDESGIIVQSPGFALASDDSIEVGEAAEQQARLQPTRAYNKYWHELSLDPVSHGNRIRHFADIAYAQLLHLAEAGDIDADVIFAVPGNFTRRQLAILLGLARQSPFNPIGVVDSALAAAIAAARSRSVIYADIQLHQVVLTRLKVKDDHLTTESVVQIPGVGSQNFKDQMMQLATGLFIQQCRFNPQHNAESEQQLYNSLPLWLRQDDDTLMLELKSATTSHRAKMPKESLISNLSGHYRNINRQITALATDHDMQLMLSAELAALPGFTASLANPDLIVVEPHIVNETVLQYRDLITTAGEEGVSLIDKLPAAGINGEPAGRALQTQTEGAAGLPTHALYGNRALAVDSIEIWNRQALNGNAAATQAIVMSLSGLPERLGRIEKRRGGVFLDSGAQEVLLNDATVSGEQRLALGDRIRFSEDAQEICLIQVSDGQ